MKNKAKQEIEKEYDMLCSIFGIRGSLWDQMHRSPSSYIFCPANQKSFIAEYLMLEDFVERAKKHGVVYYIGIDTFLEKFHDVVYNRLKIDK